MNENNSGIRIYFCRNMAGSTQAQTSLAKLGSMADVHLQSVPCSGKIDPRYVLKAFESGASAVCVLACCQGHCKRMEGNLRALRRVGAVRELLAEAGLDADSVQVFMPDRQEESAMDAAIKGMATFVSGRSKTMHETAAVR